MGVLISWDPNIPEGLESQLFVRIYRIPVELPHSTELELRKLHQIRMDSIRASALELHRGLPTSGKSSDPQNLTSLSTLQRTNLGALWRLNSHFLHTFCQEGYGGYL
jgi:hypothetical protein